MSDEKLIKTTADAIKGVAEAVPIYQDALQPAARRVGQALETVASAINLALAPLAGLVWGYEHICAYLTSRLEVLLKDVPTRSIVTPPPAIAGPTLEALRFSAGDQDLRDMFAQLLATAMNESTTSRAHPAFVEIIKQLSPPECRLVALLASKVNLWPIPIVTLRLGVRNDAEHRTNACAVPYKRHIIEPALRSDLKQVDRATTYLENLCRLGIFSAEYPAELALGSKVYERLEQSPEIREFITCPFGPPFFGEALRGQLAFTSFGKDFARACVSGFDQAE